MAFWKKKKKIDSSKAASLNFNIVNFSVGN